jgi:hypothetical protein
VKRLLRAIVGVAVSAVAAASLPVIAADDWLNLATVSMTDAVTPKLTNRYVCYSDGVDIACNAASLYVSTGGLIGIGTADPNAALDVYGTISATNFVGDGSGLTGVVASSGDRITSGSALVVVNSATGYVSFSTGGVVTGHYSPGGILSAVGISTSSNQASFTTVYASGNASIAGQFTGPSLVSTSSDGTVSGSYLYGRYASFTDIAVANGITANAVAWGNVTGKPVSLTDLISLVPDDSYIVVGSGTTWVRETGNTARTSLGLGAGDTATFANLSSSGYLNGATLQTSSYVSAGSVHTSGTVKVSNTLYADAINVPGGIAAGAVPWSGVTGKPAPIVSLSSIGDSSANSFIMGDGTSWTVVNAAQGRTGLGLGTMATQNANAVAIAGGNATGLTSISATYLYGDQVSGTSGYFPAAMITSLGAGAIAASGYVSAGSIHTSGTVKVSNTLYADAISIPGGITAGAVAWLDVTGKPASLVSLSGISTSAANHFIMGDGTSWTVVNTAQGRTGLGLGTMATQNANAVAITGGDATGLTSISASYLYGNQISGTTGYFPGATITALSAGSVGANTVSSALVSATNISATMIQVGAGGTCADGVSGSIRYGAASNTLQICTGTGWVSLVSGSNGAGVSQMSLLTDVQLTNLAGRDYLRYDAGANKWMNISESTAMSTTTAVPNWPDGIKCYFSSSNLYYTLTPFYIYPGASVARYNRANDTGTYIEFTYSTQAFSSGSGLTGADCNNKSVPQLYADGLAFNYIGSGTRWQDVPGFTYLTANKWNLS